MFLTFLAQGGAAAAMLAALAARAMAAAACAGVLLACCVLRGQVSRDDDVKAGFLLHFAQFVEWPSQAFPDAAAPFVIGILGTLPFQGALDKAVNGETVRNRKVEVRRYERVEDVRDCQILFIGTSEAPRISRVLAELKSRPILTVSEIDGFAYRGGMIGMFKQDAKVRLRINDDAARAVHLVISSKLLRLAEVIPPHPFE
jgi:YfiR/HmsC-like